MSGETVLRFDDANPTAEKQEFIDSILDNVACARPHAGARRLLVVDYFDQLYALALQLIDAGGAYVCHQTKEEMAASRGALRAHRRRRRAAAAAVASCRPRVSRRGAVGRRRRTVRTLCG